MSIRTIGLIGTGIMGLPMGGHLLSAGYALRITTRTKAKAAPLLERGATWCDCPAEVARGAEAVITLVPDTPDVLEVLFGPRGAAESLAAGSIFADMSTIAPHAAREIALRLSERGVAALDAPITGGQVGAVNATLTIMAGGPAQAFERMRPVFEKLGRKVVHVGPSGAGQTLKACNQILCAVNMIGVCEALQLARGSGLDLGQAIDTLSGGAGGSWAWTTLGGKLAAGDLNPAFMIKLMQKDLRIAQAVASELRAEMPGVRLAQELFARVEATPGGAELGTQGMMRAYERPMD